MSDVSFDAILPRSYEVNTQQIEDRHLPQVSFSTKIGRKVKFIDFDYDAFFSEAEKMGIPKEYTQNLSVNITTPIPLVHGSYSSSEKSIQVSFKGNKKTNKILAHELRHAADDTHGKNKSSIPNIIGSLGLISCIPSAITYYGTLLSGNESINNLSFRAYALSCAAHLTCYTFRPIEIRARKAARKNKAQFIKATIQQD